MAATFSAEDHSLLIAHLQATVDVELFTIPLYLTATYSFTQAALNNDAVYNLQQKTLSVAVQEMYHLQQACNLCNVFGITPDIQRLTIRENEVVKVPHLDPDHQVLMAQLDNITKVIPAMVTIETPDPGKPPRPNRKVTYPSIADLYRATLELLGIYYAVYESTPANLDPHFQPGRDQVAYGAFADRYKYNKIQTRGDVINTANAITDQGEGGTVASPNRLFSYGADGDVLPQYQDQVPNRFLTFDTQTHYKRFVDIQTALASLPSNSFYARGVKTADYPWAPPIDTLQSSVSMIWSYLLDTMAAGFAAGNLPTAGFNDAMVAFKYVIPVLWSLGVCPSFIYQKGVTEQTAYQAMDDADPWCLFHFDPLSQQVRQQYPNDLNVCQGLNHCAGRGWGGTGTQPGDCACSIADIHTCSGTNTCKGQGGCGFLASYKGSTLPPEEQFVPGLNLYPTGGGCQTPIATPQIFTKNPGFPSDWTDQQKAPLVALEGSSVWTQARVLFAQKLGVPVDQLPAPRSVQGTDVDYDGDKRRLYVQPTST